MTSPRTKCRSEEGMAGWVEKQLNVWLHRVVAGGTKPTWGKMVQGLTVEPPTSPLRTSGGEYGCIHREFRGDTEPGDLQRSLLTSALL